jgi:protein dithiol oxidoreductase (disulfide-forming)
MTEKIDLHTRQFLKMLAAGAAALAAGCTTDAAGDAQEEPEEGFEYRAAAHPYPTASKGRLEVVEFFWYGCPHCNAIEPLLKDWQRKLPPDVAFRKVHVGLAPQWVPHQQLFYTLQVLDKDEALNDRVFDALHVGKAALSSRDQMADFVAAHGVDRRRFVETFDSDAVRVRMAQADHMAAAFGLEGVPGFAINGRWYTSPSLAGSRADALRVVDFLLARERAGVR